MERVIETAGVVAHREGNAVVGEAGVKLIYGGALSFAAKFTDGAASVVAAELTDGVAVVVTVEITGFFLSLW